MATASTGRADKGASQAPARTARPCSAPASRSRGSIRPETDDDEDSSVDGPAQRGAQE
jgi:hypothetical protein